ncbi:MAG: hypothetical protein P4M15_08325 [Alphaproteobacteria bacterium]|nr:hypothetical protein [Alphaproteobacteria bacterium]
MTHISQMAAAASPRRPKAANDVVRLNSQSDFIVVDIRDSIFTDKPQAHEKLANLYRDTFNSVAAVEAKWTEASANDLIRTHTRTLGCNLVLLDNNRNIVGAFLSSLFPSQGGWEIGYLDVFISKGQQAKGLSGELSLISLEHADRIAQNELGSQIVGVTSTTYRVPEQPKKYWADHGSTLKEQYTLTAQEIASHGRFVNQTLKVEIVSEAQTSPEEIADFISHTGTTSSDGKKWDKESALTYANFMLENHPATFAVTHRYGEIVAVNSLVLMPSRTGPSGVNVHSFVSANGAEEQADIVRASMAKLVDFAKGAAVSQWGKSFSSLEIPEAIYPFFKNAFHNIQADPEFLSLEGNSRVIRGKFNERLKRSKVGERIATVPTPSFPKLTGFSFAFT